MDDDEDGSRRVPPCALGRGQLRRKLRRERSVRVPQIRHPHARTNRYTLLRGGDSCPHPPARPKGLEPLTF